MSWRLYKTGKLMPAGLGECYPSLSVRVMIQDADMMILSVATLSLLMTVRYGLVLA